MNTRIAERYYPYFLTIILLFFIYFFEFDFTIMSNPINFITSIITFSAISLGFVGVMLGLIISIKNSNAMKSLKAKNAVIDLFRYIKETTIFDFISLFVSLYFSITLKSDSELLKTHAYILFFLVSMMLLCSQRMISILFALAKSYIIDSVSDSDNLRLQKFYAKKPEKLNLPQTFLKKQKD